MMPDSRHIKPPIQIAKRKKSGGNGDGRSEERSIKKRKTRNVHPGLTRDMHLDLEHGVNFAVGNMDKHLLADHIARQTKRFLPELSPVELEDLRIPEKAIQDTSNWTKARLLQNLPEFLDQYSSPSGLSAQLASAFEKEGAPHTLVIASAGLRAADVTRALRVFQTEDATIAKLFAKHIKLKDAVDYVKRTRMAIGVGTPSRIIDLFLAGALSFENVERVVVDSSYIDMKKRSIFDMRETQKPLVQLLNQEDLKSRYSNSSKQSLESDSRRDCGGDSMVLQINKFALSV